MIRTKKWFAFLIAVTFLMVGCAPLLVGGAAVTAGAGTYVFISGWLKTDYHYPFEEVWSACEKAVAEMNAVDVIPIKEIGEGKIKALIDNETVWFSVKYKSKNITTVSIRVGILGSRPASQRLHDMVHDYLKKG
ncbi:MAG: DUF3568 family protein [Thermodesulfobacteriota bacterium]|nr:DUF3568 family protein [Thermodesulfobacteriota bacterium]